MESKEPKEVNSEEAVNPDDLIDFDADNDKSWQFWKILICVICLSVSAYIVKSMFFSSGGQESPQVVEMREKVAKLDELKARVENETGEAKAEIQKEIDKLTEELKNFPMELMLPMHAPPAGDAATPTESSAPAEQEAPAEE